MDGLNEALLAKAAEAKLLRTSRVRADTTVVAANVCYPTDSGLLAKAIRRISTAGQRIHNAGGAVRTRLRDRSRAAGKRAHGIAAKLRSRSQLGRDQVKDGVQRITGELADLAQATVRDAQRLLVNARRALRQARAKAAKLAEAGVHDAAAGRRRGRLARAVNDLSNLLEATEQIIGQTRQRIAGITPDGASRVVSLHDRDARPIAKGRLGKPVEFGHKAQIVDNDDGIVLDHTCGAGQSTRRAATGPGGEAGHQTRGRSHTADRHRRPRLRRSQGRQRQLTDLGVKNVVIPRKGRPSQARRAEEHRKAFRRTIKWRTGSEGRISHLKRGYGWDRTRIDGIEGSPDLDRTRSPRPQPGQDQRPRRVTGDRTRITGQRDRQRHQHQISTGQFFRSHRSGLKLLIRGGGPVRSGTGRSPRRTPH